MVNRLAGSRRSGRDVAVPIARFPQVNELRSVPIGCRGTRPAARRMMPGRWSGRALSDPQRADERSVRIALFGGLGEPVHCPDFVAGRTLALAVHQP